jgi:hypothetical protein
LAILTPLTAGRHRISVLVSTCRGYPPLMAGLNAVGRTINTRFDLDKNYRNTREIMKVAAEFVSC